MFRSSPLFLLLALFICCSHGAKVLFTFFHDRGSHFGSMLPLMEKLSRHGHSVSVLDTIHHADRSLLVRHIRSTLPQDVDDPEMREQFADFFWNQTDSSVTLPEFYGHMDQLLGTLMLNYSEKMADLINEDWDLLVIDDLMWPFGYFLATLKLRLAHPSPRVVVYGTAAQTLHSAESVRATSRNWVYRVPFCPYMPTNSDDVYQPTRFTHRLHAFYENFAEHILLNWLTEQYMMPNVAKYGVPNFTWYELFSQISMQFSEFIDRMGWPMSEGPEMLNLGSHCHPAPSGPLPPEFLPFLNDPASQGTILVAFGTYPDWDRAPFRIRAALFGAFRRLPSFRFFFSYNGPSVPDLPANVLLTKWAPQAQLLAHPNIRAFITHGGLKSVKEGLCAGVPLIVLPLFAEQAHQAHLVLAMGIGPVINKYTLTEDSVFRTIQGVVSDSKSPVRAQKFRQIYADRQMPPLNEALFRIEKMIRNRKEAERRMELKLMRRRGMELGWAQFAHLDLAILLLGTIFIISAKI